MLNMVRASKVDKGFVTTRSRKDARLPAEFEAEPMRDVSTEDIELAVRKVLDYVTAGPPDWMNVMYGDCTKDPCHGWVLNCGRCGFFVR